MFKFQDCFLSTGVFNDTLIKRFKENYDPSKGSRLWMIPGHVIYTTPDQKVYTCDSRPLDLLSPSEPSTGELISSHASVLEIFFETEGQSLRMYIALGSGDVQIFEYRTMLYEWARIGYFNLNITSPNNTNHQHYNVDGVFISPHQNIIYWFEKVGTGDMCLTLQKRILPLNSVREITQTSIGVPQPLLKNCPKCELLEISENICIIPDLPNSINLYLILSARSHLWVFDISGKCLWRGVINEQSMDFLSLCIKIVGLWTQQGTIKVCHSLFHHHKTAYIFHDNNLLSITSSGEISKKTKFELSVKQSHDIYILWNILCVFTNNALLLYHLDNGKLFQTLSLENYVPIRGIWSHTASLPCLGFYTDATIFMLQPQSLISILNSKDSCFSQVLNVLSQGNVLLYTLMRDLVYDKATDMDLVPLQEIPDILQSQALLLALFHLCQTKGICTKNFPFTPAQSKALLSLSCQESYPETKLKKILEPLVECYCKIEDAKKQL